MEVNYARGNTCKTEYTLTILCGFDRASSLICGNKMTTRCNRWFLLQILLLAQHVSGTIMPIRVLHRWLSSTPYRQLENQAPNTTGSNHLYNTLELLMGIMVPETCWASNKICNKNHLLHLVGILFPQKNLVFETVFKMHQMQPIHQKHLDNSVSFDGHLHCWSPLHTTAH